MRVYLLTRILSFSLLTTVIAIQETENARAANEGHVVHLRAKRSVCYNSWSSDGWCDFACNSATYKFDGGDCCKHSCKSAKYLCGSGGFDCKTPKVPVWFLAHTKLCYKWSPSNNGQCGAGEPTDLCANVNAATQYYRDDTDNRGGGCFMSWAIKSPYSPSWFKSVQICYRWYPDGDGGQCGGGAARLLCARVGYHTPVYVDDTDSRSGGCRMSWQLKLPSVHDGWARNIKLCYEWYPDGNGGQCGGGAARKLCAKANNWTPYYRDDTDNRGGGCRMRWGLFYDQY
ncbi:perivitellin-2 67 kDa subunit-like [Dendronephthya gigantea]|uniref:perivitellin-2 67 kDa subunit-like n=1 Tax=Dendronephthya gigantea TaxID=151771 RepID=UPI00106BE827|nr:perivitellin-2 67 kDa subunit-like [Dendronephthya gigantea]